MRQFTAVLLDVDGTLIDSNDAHAHSWCDALAEFDRPVEFARIRRLIGKGGDKLLAETVGLSNTEGPGRSISRRRQQLFLRDHVPNLKPFPQSAELVRRMHDEGFKLAIATSAKTKEMNILLEIVGVQSWIDATTSSDDAEESKPDPDIVCAAIQKLKVPASQSVLLGDTPYDIEAATRADVATIALLSGGWQLEDLQGSLAVYRDCSHLLDHFEQSPLGTRT
jgi:phosphoglycolate phosphatase-like HAD superfamily hydrolase